MSRKRAEDLEKIGKALEILKGVAEGPQTPKNIRKVVKETVSILSDGKLSPAVRAANVISMLDEVMQDPNMPSFIRVTLWNAFSLLEGIRE